MAADKPCVRCKTAHREPGRGSYCRECHNELKRESDHRIRGGLERRRAQRESADYSVPPPPPPGFNVRDLFTARPLA